jgi:hypothetical protein
VDRATREFEEIDGFDAMEIARVDYEGPERAAAYYQRLKDSCEGTLARREALVREWATNYEAEKAAEEEGAWRN